MNQRTKLILVLAIPIISFIVGIATLNHYGINWDEPYHYRRGQAFLQYYLTGQKTYNNIPKYPPLKGDSDNPDFRNAQKNLEEVQKDPSLSNPNIRRSFYQDDSWNGQYFIDIESAYGHPALNDVLGAIFNKIFYQKLRMIGDLESYRFFVITIVFIATAVTALFMWREFGFIESIFTSIGITTYPLLVGEQHFNIKDPVELSFFTLTIISSYLGLKKNKLWLLLVGTFCFALALSTKFNIVFSLIPLLVWFIYHLRRTKKIKKGKLFKNIGITLIIAPIIAIVVLVLSYPTLWKNPVIGLSEIVKFYLEVGYPKSLPSGYYLFGFINALPLVWIIFTTPPIEILLFIFSIFFSKKIIKKNSFVLLLLVWIAITIGRNSLFSALSYGGVRLIMEYIPALAMLAGIGAGVIVNHNKNKNYKLITTLIILLAFVPTISKLIKIHPNENVYFNILVGGLSGAKAMNLPSWGNSNGNAYYGGIVWLNEHAEKNAKVSIPIGNTSNIPRFKLRPDIAVSPFYWSGLSHKGEYLIELTYDYTPMNWFALKYLNEAMNPVYEVNVDGVAIAKVWKNDPEFVKPEFTKTKDIEAKIKSNLKTNTIEIDIPNPEKIMKVSLNEPIKNCTPLHTGYVESSVDGKNWSREIEDIAIDQVNREEIKKLDKNYEYLFMAKNATSIIFHTDSPGNCLLKSTKATITFLNP